MHMEQDYKEYKPVDDTIDLEELYELMKPYETRTAQKTQPDASLDVSSGIEAATKREAAAPRKIENRSRTDKTKKAKKAKKEEAEAPLYECYGILHDIAYILIIVTLLFVFVVRLVGVDGESMLPTLHNGDYLILESNFFYGAEDIETGDIVVLTVPHFKDEPIVKRVIATGGQTVDIDFQNHVVYVDGVALDESYLIDYTGQRSWDNWTGDYALEYPAQVPEGCIFVLGDNRNNSTDSRFAPVGMVDTRCVLGKVLAIALPGETRDDQGNITDPRDWSRIGLVD